MSKVVVVKTRPETVLEDIEKAMLEAGLKNALDTKAVTILKDNISWHMPYLSANTTPWQLEGTIRGLKNSGFNEVVAVHNNTVVTNPFKGSKLNRLDKVYQKYGIKELYNFLPQDIKWVKYQPKAKMLALEKIFPEGIRIPEYFVGKNIVHLPTLKTHIYTTTTGAMKNAFGGLLNTKRHYTHTWIHETLVDLLAIQKEIHTGLFSVMDGTIAGSGPGPRTMTPHEKDYILVSSDMVAIDAIASKMMGFDPMSLPYIRLAHEHGLGIGNPSEIEVVGEDISHISFSFKVGRNLAARAGHTFWFGPLKGIQHLFFRTPLVYIFVFASFIYHDYLWWPLIGRNIQKKVRKETKWGRLFESY